MKKGNIIALSIFGVVVALIGVLFGAVFRLRSQTVSVLEHDMVEINKNEIISAAGIKNGQSIFMIDKESAINNIEAKFPTIKVIQIKTTSITKIEIKVRLRHEMFYTEHEGKFLILDEDLKLLRIEESSEPINLVHIETESLNINKETNVCDFLGNNYQRKVISNIYHAMLNVVKDKTDEITEYYTREDVCDIIKNIKIENFNSFNKVIITTKHGVKFDIENPTRELTNKMNICLTTMNKFIADGEDKEKSGTIKIYFDENNHQKCIYIP